MEIIGYLSTVFVGLTLGLIGSGGTILTVPILVYFFKIQPDIATTYSLFIVGINAIFGSVSHIINKHINYKIAIVFAIPSLTTLLLIRLFVINYISENLYLTENFIISKDFMLMILFSMLMIYAGLKLKSSDNDKINNNYINYKLLFLLGIFLGIIMGFLGAGGGFLIVPALIIYAGMDFKNAVGTSLLIVSLNAIIGFMGDIISGVEMKFQLLITLTFIALIGMMIGAKISKKLPSEKIKPIFGWLLIAIALIIIYNELNSLKISL